jgi:hypothetical protein
MDVDSEGRWADWRSTVALTGILPSDLAWALSRGAVNYSLSRPGHEGVLMVCVDDVEVLVTPARGQRYLRVVRDGS